MSALGLLQFAARFKQLPTQEADALTSLAEPPRDPMERHAIVLAHSRILPLYSGISCVIVIPPLCSSACVSFGLPIVRSSTSREAA